MIPNILYTTKEAGLINTFKKKKLHIKKKKSTLVIITIDLNVSKIYTAYIGDSGYMIFRYNGEELDCVFEFEE